mmetsp:Transcript_32680/g.76985  ORF Transcript_32680/g.76985 Transcript_32680/m.76985 type:complete len:246 (-) Transcript_32680:5-742(-)
MAARASGDGEERHAPHVAPSPLHRPHLRAAHRPVAPRRRPLRPSLPERGPAGGRTLGGGRRGLRALQLQDARRGGRDQEQVPAALGRGARGGPRRGLGHPRRSGGQRAAVGRHDGCGPRRGRGRGTFLTPRSGSLARCPRRLSPRLQDFKLLDKGRASESEAGTGAWWWRRQSGCRILRPLPRPIKHLQVSHGLGLSPSLAPLRLMLAAEMDTAGQTPTGSNTAGLMDLHARKAAENLKELTTEG